MENERDGNAEGGAKSDEDPQGRKPKNKNQAATDREQTTFESSSNGELVHCDSGMTFLGHGTTSSFINDSTKV